MDETPPAETPADPASGRALRRAGVHFVKAAIEVVAGLEVLIEELRRGDREPVDGGAPGLQRIELDDDPGDPDRPSQSG